MHLLKHLPEQVLQRGSLDETSAFKYENVQKLLLKLYKPNRFQLRSVRNYLVKNNMFESHGLKHVNQCGTDVEKQTIKFKHFTLKANEKDCYFEAGGTIYKMEGVPVRGWVEAYPFRSKKSYYYCLTTDSERFHSQEVGVYKISHLSSHLSPVIVDINSIKYKYVVHPHPHPRPVLPQVFIAYRLI